MDDDLQNRRGSGHLLPPDPTPNPSFEMTELISKVQDLTAKFAQLEEATNAEISDLRADYILLQKNHSTLQKDHVDLHKEHIKLQNDHTRLKQKLTEVKVYLKAFQTEQCQVLTDHGSMKKVQEGQKAEMNLIRLDQRTHLSTLDTLRQQQSDALEEMREEMTALSSDLDLVKGADAAQQQNLNAELLGLRSDLVKLQEEGLDPALAEQRRLLERQDTLTSDVDILKTDVGQVKAAVEDLLSEACSSSTAVEIRVGKNKLLLFSASGMNEAATQQLQPMIFQTVDINEGGHYCVDTGQFTAHLSGHYFITAKVSSHRAGLTACAYIMVDEERHRVIYGDHCGGSRTLFVPLAAEQRVWVKTVSPPDSYSHRDPGCSFSAGVIVSLGEESGVFDRSKRWAGIHGEPLP